MLDEVRIDGAKIKALREARGWTQRDLWQKSGVDQAVISALESNQKGDIFYRTIRMLAHTLGVRTDDLLASPESMKVEPTDPQINVAMKLVNDMTAEERAIMQKHVAYWSEYAARGIAIVFGSVMDPQGVYGIGVYQVEDEVEMRNLLDHDPADRR